MICRSLGKHLAGRSLHLGSSRHLLAGAAANLLADPKRKAVFDSKDKVSMFEMNEHLAKHFQ